MPVWGNALKKAKAVLDKYKYLLIVVAAGIILLLLPTGGGNSAADEETPSQAVPGLVSASIQLEESKLEGALSSIYGVGRVNVTLSLKAGGETVYAMEERSSEKSDSEPASSSVESEKKPSLVSKQSGGQDALIIKQLYPEYKGALVICDGADDSTVKLQVTEAVSKLLGLGSDKIVVVRMK